MPEPEAYTTLERLTRVIAAWRQASPEQRTYWWKWNPDE